MAPKTAPTVGLSVDLITSLIVAPSLMALLTDCRRVWAPSIATGLKNRADVGIKLNK